MDARAPDTLRMSLGAAIKGLRQEKGWSQEDLADRVGTTAATISRIETGRHGAVDSLKVLIATQFGIKVSELIAMSEAQDNKESEPAAIAEAKLLASFRALSPAGRLLLIDFLQLLQRHHGGRSDDGRAA